MPAVPTKLFDVRNGNNAVDADATAYPRATLIVFKDNASKNAVMKAFADAYGYQATVPDPATPGATIPNPQSEQGFFNRLLQDYIRGIYKAQKEAAATAAALATATAANAELP